MAGKSRARFISSTAASTPTVGIMAMPMRRSGA